MNRMEMYRVHQLFPESPLRDPEEALRAQFARSGLEKRIKVGQSVAVGVGSRGIRDLPLLVRTTVDSLKELGLRPFLFPAMGSHGGATAEGQRCVLQDLGVSEESMGVPVVSSMEVVSLGCIEGGMEVFFSKDALEADHVVVINRIKPHTAFRGKVESGLCKMLVIGCGKHRGAMSAHRFDIAKTLLPASRLILERVSILCGVAVVENARKQIQEVRLVSPWEFISSDAQLLEVARRHFPRLPLDELDILIVDEMGKDISGAGIDPNVIGFWRREGGPRQPDYRILVVLDLTEPSHGNATGVGMADLIPRRLKDKIDLHATYTNALTSGVLRSARLPMVLEDDRRVLEAALACVPHPERARVARIVNTLSLETFWVTPALLPELRAREEIRIDDRPLPLQFDNEDRLLPFPP